MAKMGRHQEGLLISAKHRRMEEFHNQSGHTVTILTITHSLHGEESFLRS